LRQRKDKIGGNGYSKSAMNETLKLLETTVSDILQKYPQVNRLFIHQKTACIGCHMARFCTLKDVISIYEKDQDAFLAELKEVINNSIQSYQGE